MKRIGLLLLLVVLDAGSVWAQNKALSLDGDGDYVEIPHSKSLDITDKITMEAWIFPVPNLFDTGIIGKRTEGNIGGYVMQWREGKVESWLWIDGNWRGVRGEQSLSPEVNQWHHVVCIHDGKEMRQFVDGKLDFRLPISGSIESVDAPLTIGKSYVPTIRDKVDEVRIWNVARTEAEIKASMNTTLTGKENGLVGYWNFDDGTAKDLTANGNDGEFKGGAKVIDSDLALGVFIPDPNLRAALEKALDKNEGDEITENDLAKLTELKASKANIYDLTGLEHCKNLKFLYLNENNKIRDLSPLSELTQLVTIELSKNKISSLQPLSNLSNLSYLNLAYNEIGDISPLSRLTKLKELVIYWNHLIADITPLSGLTNLTKLNIHGNKISDLQPLKNLTDLTWLDLYANKISDITPLSNLTNLLHLNLAYNQIKDVLALSKLTKLGSLDLVNNQIEDLKSLIDNPGITGSISISTKSETNPLTNYALYTQIPTLESRGIAVGYYAPPRPKLSFSTVTAMNLGAIAEIELLIDEVTSLAGWSLDLEFDPQILSLESVKEGNALTAEGKETFFQKGKLDNELGSLIGLNSVYLGTGGLTAVGTLVTLSFKAIKDGESYLRLKNVKFGNPKGNEIPIEVINTTITVSSVPPCDVNANGTVDIFDLILVAQVFGQESKTRADTNGDGVVNIFDLIVVAQCFGQGAAPAIVKQPIAMFSMVENWIRLAEQANDGSTEFNQGISVLREILESLKPEETVLMANYPNPFNPETWIPYHLGQDSEVIINIYDTTGKIIRSLDMGFQSFGYYASRDNSAYWDGRTENGEQVSSGTYFYQIEAGDYTETRKMVILK